MGYICGFLTCAAIIWAVCATIRASQQKQLAQAVYTAATASLSNSRLDELIYSRQLLLPEETKNELDAKIIAVVQYIARESVSRAGIAVDQVTDDDRFAAMVICLTASDYISQKYNHEFEIVSSVSCLTLYPTVNPNECKPVLCDAIASHNSPSSLKVIRAIAAQVDQFWETDEDEFLDNLAKIFALLKKHIDGRS